jgi:hypothetical protein
MQVFSFENLIQRENSQTMKASYPFHFLKAHPVRLDGISDRGCSWHITFDTTAKYRKHTCLVAGRMAEQFELIQKERILTVQAGAPTSMPAFSFHCRQQKTSKETPCTFQEESSLSIVSHLEVEADLNKQGLPFREQTFRTVQETHSNQTGHKTELSWGWCCDEPRLGNSSDEIHL